MSAAVAPQPLDEELLADSLAEPPLEDARESLAYWHARRERLPRRRLRARREARAMTIRWEERVRRAEIERFGAGLLGRLRAAADARRLDPAALGASARGLARRAVRLGAGLAAAVVVAAGLAALASLALLAALAHLVAG